jgi:hypothetical protein
MAGVMRSDCIMEIFVFNQAQRTKNTANIGQETMLHFDTQKIITQINVSTLIRTQ